MEVLKKISRIYPMGSSETEGILYDPVVVEEKIDGSQFNFGVAKDGILWLHSHHQPINPLSPPKMFTEAVQTVMSLADKLMVGHSYHAEAVQSPHHNVLKYARVPMGGMVLWDICDDQGVFLPYDVKAQEADRLRLECVPRLFNGYIKSDLQLKALVDDTISILGGTTIEGVVVKNRVKGIMGKYVSLKFRETKGEGKTAGISDGLNHIIHNYRTEARFSKAYIHLKEQNKIQGNVKDIGSLVQEVGDDIAADAKTGIMEALWASYWPAIRKGVVRGVAEWYKDFLLKSISPLQGDKLQQDDGDHDIPAL